MRLSSIRALVIGLLVMIGTSSAIGQSVDPNIRVVDRESDQDGPGTSWQTAFHDLQDALDAAEAAGGAIDQIWIANGTYVPSLPVPPDQPDRIASFELVNGVWVYGGFHGADGAIQNGETKLSHRDIFADNTQVILSGELGGEDHSHHVVKAFGFSMIMKLDGVTVTGGAAVESLDHPMVDESGGGILVEDATFHLVNSTIKENVAGTGDEPNPSFEANGGGLVYTQNLGAGETVVSDAAIYNCQFISNGVHGSSSRGGAINLDKISIKIVNCLFAGNEAGAGLNPGSYTRGGEIYTTAGADEGEGAKIVNCTFANNRVKALLDNPGPRGPAVFVGNGTTTIVNSIAWFNEQIIDGNSMFRTFALNENPTSNADLTVSYSAVQDGLPPAWDGENNINPEDGPGFVNGNPPSGPADYRLQSVSPARDSGSGSNLPYDRFDVDNDGIAEFIPPNGGEPVPDLDHVGRTFGSVDMGAYEYCESPYDLDGDRLIGFTDLLEVLTFWGPCADCPQDFNGDDIVGFSDLLDVLTWWGPCGNYGATAAPASIGDCLRKYGGDTTSVAKCIEAMMLAGTP